MNTLEDWALAWGVPLVALADLRARIGAGAPTVPVQPVAGGSEAAVTSRVRLAAAKQGLRLWRNNSGAGYNDAGQFMRWGLGNESAGVNRIIKSGDFIGIRPRIIQPSDLGRLIGQFVSFEIKHAGWTYRGDEREEAQLNWANLVMSLGGEGRFITSEREV